MFEQIILMLVAIINFILKLQMEPLIFSKEYTAGKCLFIELFSCYFLIQSLLHMLFITRCPMAHPLPIISALKASFL